MMPCKNLNIGVGCTLYFYFLLHCFMFLYYVNAGIVTYLLFMASTLMLGVPW
jgi:hypothetical protein